MSSSSSHRSRKTASLSRVCYSNAVYFPNYKIYSGLYPCSLDYRYINTVYYCFANVGPDGGVFLSDEHADVQAYCGEGNVKGGLISLLHLKQKHPHLQVILSIGGAESSQVFPTIAASAALRHNFARSARGLVEASGLDGIDIVWQYPADALQGANFLTLLAAVRLHLPEESYILTAALPASRSVLDNIDLRRAADYLDLLNLMAYDFHGPWTSRSGHHAQLYPSGKEDQACGSSIIASIVSQGFPGKKLLLGIPGFGRSLRSVPGPGHRIKGSTSSTGEATFDYHQLPRKGAREFVDKRACAAFCVGGEGGFVVSYDNPETVKMKADFVRQKGLGGLFYWTGPKDAKERDSKRSLVAAGFKALHTS